MIGQEQLISPSDTSPEEDLAICLMLLSRDAAGKKKAALKKKKRKAMRADKFKCDKCMKRYRTCRALVAHRRICDLDSRTFANEEEKIFECPYCFRLFGSGQALGGHKRSHLTNGQLAGTRPRNDGAAAEDRPKKCCMLDLNLPASAEEDEELSVIMEA